MRNLKKFLALVLAMVMAFSLMVSANAAVTKVATKDSDVYTDGDTVLTEFQTAVDVLTGMGIFHGSSGEFNAKSGITRAEAAAVLYRLVTGDVEDKQAQLYAPLATQRFTDVKEGSWYAGYVGFAVDAGLVNGYNGRFMPANQVTGYEMLKMLLKAVGYGKNGEFTGAMWQINVGSTAQSASVSADAAANNRNILSNIEKTHYKDTLSKASAREVVAEMTFQVALNVPMVEYQYGWYNPYQGVPNGNANNVLNPSLGRKVFGLAHNTIGVVIGNQDTGEKNTIINMAGNYRWVNTNEVQTFDVVTGLEMFGRKIDIYYSTFGTVHPVYAYYDNSTLVKLAHAVDDPATGIALNNTTAANTLGAVASGNFWIAGTGAVMSDSFGRTGSKVGASDGAAYGNGQRSNTMEAGANKIVSPIHEYLLISNSSVTTPAGVTKPSLDVVIALNIEATQITESNSVRGVETVAMPVNNGINGNTIAQLDQRSWGNGTNYPYFVMDKTWDDGTTTTANMSNVQNVAGVQTGIVAKAALTKTAHESASALGDYVLGIHINGTNQNADNSYARSISAGEKAAINPTGAALSDPAPVYETGYFLLNKATEVTGKVIQFSGRTVILEVNGQRKELEKSYWYETVVCTNYNNVTPDVIPEYALPQSVAYDSIKQKWVESYNNEEYTFYLDYEGKYLGAKRGYSNSFIYGTYLDYRQDLNSSKFEYFLTGVDINGEKVIGQPVSKYWTWSRDQDDPVNDKTNWRKVNTINSTQDVGVPYRDSKNNNKLNDSMPYIGFTYTNGTLDWNVEAKAVNKTDYSVNMERLGIYRGLSEGSSFKAWNDGVNGLMATRNASETWSNGLAKNIVITSGGIAVGAIQTESKYDIDGNTADALKVADNNTTDSGLYLTENTTFILVSGYGSDSLESEVIKGISKLGACTIKLNPNDLDAWMNGNADENDVPFAAQTYFKLGASIFSQTGQTAYEVDTVILPKAAVDHVTSSSKTSYFMGDPACILTSANEGSPYYQYKVYDLEGNETKIWLDENSDPASVAEDTFLTVTATDKKAADGSPVYSANFHRSIGANAVWKDNHVIDGENKLAPAGTYASTVIYQPINGTVATFTWLDSDDDVNDPIGSVVLNVSKAKVTNINATKADGGIWPGVTDLSTLNHAGSIYNTTGTPIRVAAVCQNNVDVTQIFICWNQNPADDT